MSVLPLIIPPSAASDTPYTARRCWQGRSFSWLSFPSLGKLSSGSPQESPFPLQPTAIPKPENAFILSSKWEMLLSTKQPGMRLTGGTELGRKGLDSFSTTALFPAPQKRGGHLVFLAEVRRSAPGAKNRVQEIFKWDVHRAWVESAVARQQGMRLWAPH